MTDEDRKRARLIALVAFYSCLVFVLGYFQGEHVEREAWHKVMTQWLLSIKPTKLLE